jgi:hypothetical protein
MQKRLSILVFLALALSLALAACGGGDGDDAGDPTKVVKDLMKAIEDKKFDKIPDFACAAQKEEVADTFDFGAMMTDSFGGVDIDPQKVLDAMNFKVSNLEVKEVSKSDDKATVHVKGRLEIKIDPEKFKDVVRELLKAQGMTDVPDSLIDQAMEAVVPQLEEFGEDLDDDLALIKEGGKWVICDQ